MIKEVDKQIYFPRSFNEQMAWIGEEVEHIIKYNEAHKIKEEIKKATYGEVGYTHAIKRLFEIIKADPKNKALLREVNKAEEELKSFLYDESDALSEKEIFQYWNNYEWAYVAELEYAPKAYFIHEGFDENYDTGEWIGIFYSLSKAKEAYEEAVVQLQNQHEELKNSVGESLSYALEHEKIMIHIFDEKDNRWSYDVNPDELFNNLRCGGENSGVM